MTDLAATIAAVRREGRERNTTCPAHKDTQPSLSVGISADGRILLHCHRGCSFDAIVEAAALERATLMPPASMSAHKRRLIDAYDYRDANGDLLYQSCRFEPKTFRLRKPDGCGDWTWTIGNVRRVLFQLPMLKAQSVVFIVEGEKDAKRLTTLGFAATTNAGGAGKWRDDYAEQLTAAGTRSVVVIPDHDDVGAKHGHDVALSCRAAGLEVRLIELPGLPDKGDISDWLDAGHTREELTNIISATPLYSGTSTAAVPTTGIERRSLAETAGIFQRWLYLEDLSPLYAVAAALVANRALGDPVWLLLVCAPSTGKTEILSAACGLPWVIPAAKVTEASLLSGTSKREHAVGATGGLLRQIGDRGVLLCKDFTSVLAQNKDTRAEAMAALREIYDGAWHRPVGTDGGRVLSWSGKCGFIGGVTPALDQYGQVTSSLGDRFVLLRMPDADVHRFGVAALTHGDHERAMRQQLQQALAGLVDNADTARVNRELSGEERDRLIGLAAYTARARTAVPRDGYQHDVLYQPQVEGPGRLVKVYARLLGGLEAIGCDSQTVWMTLTRIAIDCAPALRTKVIRQLVVRAMPARTSDIAEAIEAATKTASRYLEDLSLLKLAIRTKSGSADNSPDLWEASDMLRELWPLKSETEKYVRSHSTQVTAQPAADIGHNFLGISRSHSETEDSAQFAGQESNGGANGLLY